MGFVVHFDGDKVVLVNGLLSAFLGIDRNERIVGISSKIVLVCSQLKCTLGFESNSFCAETNWER